MGIKQYQCERWKAGFIVPALRDPHPQSVNVYGVVCTTFREMIDDHKA